MHAASDKLTFCHFADDTTVYMRGSNLRQLCVDVSAELLKVSEWMNANRLSLYVQKTSLMIFTHKSVNGEEVLIEIAGERVQQATSAKFLGIRIDDRLCFNEHTIVLCKKLCALGIMYIMSMYQCFF